MPRYSRNTLHATQRNATPSLLYGVFGKHVHRGQPDPTETRRNQRQATGTGGRHRDETESQADGGPHDQDPQGADHHPVGFDVKTRRRSPDHSQRVKSAWDDTSIAYESARRSPYGTARTKPDAQETPMERSSTTKAESFALIGTKQGDAVTARCVTSTSAQDVATSLMEPRSAISQRRQKPLTPLVADEWESQLQSSQLLQRYPQIPVFIRCGAHAGIPHILHSFTPLNNPSTESLSDIFYDIIQSEFNKGRYLGPFSKEELENEIGPFQSSPLSLVPKPGKPGKYRLIQNLSYPHNDRPTPSINSSLNSDDFPCTWGTFRTVATLIRNLPRGSQAATRDIAEAYRIIPLHESQWPGVVVRISNSPNQFALNTSNCFGGTTAGGLFGLFADALADILRANGIGPILKWVDDFVFFRIPKRALKTYNFERQITRKTIADNGGMQQSGGRLWFKGKTLDDTGAEHFAEDMNFSIQMIKEY